MKKLKKVCFICFCFSIILLNYNVLASTGVITGKSVRLRKEESTQSEAITTMKKDEKVEIIGESENWYNVNFEDKTGYVSKEYVKIVEEENTQAEPTTKETTPDDTTEDKSSENTVDESLIGKEYTLQKNAKLRLKPNFSSIVINRLKLWRKSNSN